MDIMLLISPVCGVCCCVIVPVAAILLLLTHQELYKSIEKLRPNLFRMASELKQNEEGMTDILQTNDAVLRVMDLYETKFNKTTPTTNTSNGMDDGKTGGGAVGGSSASAGSSEGATAVVSTTSTVASGSEGQGTPSTQAEASGRSDEPANALIDLADLNFDPTPITGANGSSVSGGVTDLSSSTGLGSLLNDLGMLGKDGHWRMC